MPPLEPLPADRLYAASDESQLGFETTADLEPLPRVPGQSRALDAIQLAADMHMDGFNLFVLGRSGSERHSTVRSILAGKAAEKPPASDWCYVNNFSDQKKPRVLRLPTGMGRELKGDIEQLAKDALSTIPAAFSGEDYQTRRQAIQEEFVEQQQKLFEEIREHAKALGIRIIETPAGFTFAPLRGDDVIKPEDYQKLSEEEQAQIRRHSEEIGKEIEQFMRGTPGRVKETQARVRQLNREVAVLSIGTLVEELLDKYRSVPDVTAHLEGLQVDIVDHVDLFLKASEQQDSSFSAGATAADLDEGPVMDRYNVNLIGGRAGIGKLEDAAAILGGARGTPITPAYE